MKQKYLTKNSTQTQKLGKNLAKEIYPVKSRRAGVSPLARLFNRVKKTGKTALVIGLIGELGGGKTTFLQGFAKGLGIKEKILSPTFVILKRFKITKLKTQNSKRKATAQNSKLNEFENFYHIDCYRIKKPKELLDLGFKKIISDPKNIVAIEWAEKIKKILPKNTLKIKFEFIDKKTRKISFGKIN